jgi:hydroxyacylglutathione hydrolase
MPKLGKVLVGVLVALFLVVVAVSIALRVARGKAGAPVEVAPGVWGVEAGGAWAYAVREGEGALLVDAGADPAGKGLDLLLGKLSIGRSAVREVFITHGHFDHVAGAALFPKARVYTGAADADLASGKEPPAALAARILGALAPVPRAPVSARLEERTAVAEPSGEVVVAVPIPGHTPGSFAYLAKGVLFLGDAVVLDGGKLMPPPSAFTLDEAANRRSLAALAKLADALAYDVVCTGHGGCSGPGGKKLFDAYAAAAR